MPKFANRSLVQLKTCHIDLQTLFNEVIKHFDCIVLEGYRDKEKQDIAFKTGASQKKWPDGNHNSNPSNAVDVAPDSVPLDSKADLDWKDIERFCYFGGFVLGVAALLKQQGRITHDVRWGRDWDRDTVLKDQKFNDYVHFEVVL